MGEKTMLKQVFLLSILSIAFKGWSTEETYQFKTLSEIGKQPVIPTSPSAEKQAAPESITSTIYMDKEDLIALITDYVQEKYQADYAIQLESNIPLPPQLVDQAYELALQDVQVNDNRSRLKAILVFKDINLQIPIAARLQELQEIPVFSEQDITWQKMPSNGSRGKIVTTLDELIGYQSRQRTLTAGEPIRKNDLIKPHAIKRGAMIMVSFNNKGISIQMQAKALDSGGIGEEIRVLNVDSNKILKGTIDAMGNVIIQAPTIHAAAGANHVLQ
jgi:flagella basal body P-ring formation protein FlgA